MALPPAQPYFSHHYDRGQNVPGPSSGRCFMDDSAHNWGEQMDKCRLKYLLVDRNRTPGVLFLLVITTFFCLLRYLTLNVQTGITFITTSSQVVLPDPD
ncbi:hypothetical protein BDV29DRAFT_123354 [Aspergillus leporis]|uniref:Uncharacterized protein n=1 Tax=Aspergillus leporis TaxID=41062 RepID=A0A5N5X335_9EURO|nr:hypothetical protein BDV29DRAFT_123354 [Aspergillus leporis]